MSNIVVFDSMSGEILRTGHVHTYMAAMQAQVGETVIEGTANDATQYILAGVVTDKPQLALTPDKTTVIADGVDVSTTLSVPNPTNVVITGPANDSFQVTDGSLELTFDTAGTYTVTLSAFPYLDQTIEITAV